MGSLDGVCGFHRGFGLVRIDALTPEPFEKPAQILAPESKAASVPELRGWDHTLACPSPHGLNVDAEVFRCFGRPDPLALLIHTLILSEHVIMSQRPLELADARNHLQPSLD